MVPDPLVVDLDQCNENFYQIINKLILKTENMYIEIYLFTVNPLLSPTGGLFFPSTFEVGGGGGDLIEREA